MDTIFYSWQSDTSSKTNKSFIQSALKAAIIKVGRELDLENALRIDHDTKGVPGSPDIVSTILAKIEKSDIFLADVTIVAKTENGKQVPNPNVLIELGYAYKAVSVEKVITVMNEHYGTAKAGLPFDFAHKRWPIQYNLSESASAEEKAAIKKELVSVLVAAFKCIYESYEEPVEAEYVGAEPQYKYSSFIADNEKLALLTVVDEDEDPSEIIWTNGPQAYLRLIPSAPQQEKTPFELEPLAQKLYPLGDVRSSWRARNKWGAVVYNTKNVKRQTDANQITQVFKNSEIWGIDTRYIGNHGGKLYVPTGYVKSIFLKGLRQYLDFYRLQLNGEFPVKIIAGLCGVEGVGISISNNRIAGHFVEDKIAFDEIVYTDVVSTEDVLKPFFDLIYKGCGITPPEKN